MLLCIRIILEFLIFFVLLFGVRMKEYMIEMYVLDRSMLRAYAPYIVNRNNVLKKKKKKTVFNVHASEWNKKMA